MGRAVRFFVAVFLGFSIILISFVPLVPGGVTGNLLHTAEAANPSIRMNAERKALLDRISPPLNISVAAIPPWGFPAYSGDPTQERLPDSFDVVERPAWYDGVPVTIRPFPRPSVGDGGPKANHADMFVFYYPDGTPVNQPPLLSSVPLNAFDGAVGSPEALSLAARMFSANWELHAVRVTKNYIPGSIKSLLDLDDPNLVLEDLQTNMFVTFPILPKQGNVPGLELNGADIHTAMFEGKIVRFIDYEVGDSEFINKPLYMFRKPNGEFAGDAVLSGIPGQPHISSFWDVFMVQVTAGYVANSLRSEDAVLASGFLIINSSDMFAPVEAVDGMRTRLPDFRSILTGPDGKFRKDRFPMQYAFPTQPWFTDPRLSPTTFNYVSNFGFNDITIPRLDTVAARIDVAFLLLDELGPNVSGGAKLVLPPHIARQLLVVNATGGFTHLRQSDVDNMPLNEIMARGQAIFEREIMEEDASGPSLNAYSCASCHGLPFNIGLEPTAGGGGVRFRNALQPTDTGRKTSRNTPHVFGSGILTQIGKERHAGGLPVTDDNPHPHNWKGTVPTVRDFTAGALNGEIGLQAVEKVAQMASVSLTVAATLDLDHDGFVSEMTVGDVTALTVFQAALPRPYQKNPGDPSMIKGRQVFMSTGCAGCHTPVQTLQSTILGVTNPETAGVVKVPLGDPGVELFSDLKRHKMGALLSEPGPQGGVPADVFRTQPLWGVADTAPYLHDGSANTFEEAILKHGGAGSEALPVVQAYNTISSADKDSLFRFLGSLVLPNRTQMEMDFLNRLSNGDKIILGQVLGSFARVIAAGPVLQAWTFNPPPEGMGSIKGRFTFQVSINAEAAIARAAILLDDKLSLPLFYNPVSGFHEAQLDTTTLPDGDHKLVLDIQDSKGQKPLALTTSFITVQNTAVNLNLSPHAANGFCP